jgi:Tfp pilus assembly protein PilW
MSNQITTYEQKMKKKRNNLIALMVGSIVIGMGSVYFDFYQGQFNSWFSHASLIVGMCIGLICFIGILRAFFEFTED